MKNTDWETEASRLGENYFVGVASGEKKKKHLYLFAFRFFTLSLILYQNHGITFFSAEEHLLFIGSLKSEATSRLKPKNKEFLPERLRPHLQSAKGHGMV